MYHPVKPAAPPSIFVSNSSLLPFLHLTLSRPRADHFAPASPSLPSERVSGIARIFFDTALSIASLLSGPHRSVSLATSTHDCHGELTTGKKSQHHNKARKEQRIPTRTSSLSTPLRCRRRRSLPALHTALEQFQTRPNNSSTLLPLHQAPFVIRTTHHRTQTRTLVHRRSRRVGP
ncbi:hypothetical protein FJTKL_04894 [Diaporthe vaccinii]|uniref:Uncharacterized protein n=1 Tax=Diaporthe vaccinii TaxID=105482 RepID=A0ABR4DS29_9PEZI